MLATMIQSPHGGSRSEFRRTPTAELPNLVDRILDNRSPMPATPTEEAPAKVSLMGVVRRLFSASINGLHN
jgi:hypothetical protein